MWDVYGSTTLYCEHLSPSFCPSPVSAALTKPNLFLSQITLHDERETKLDHIYGNMAYKSFDRTLGCVEQSVRIFPFNCQNLIDFLLQSKFRYRYLRVWDRFEHVPNSRQSRLQTPGSGSTPRVFPKTGYRVRSKQMRRKSG